MEIEVKVIYLDTIVFIKFFKHRLIYTYNKNFKIDYNYCCYNVYYYNNIKFDSEYTNKKLHYFICG